MSDPTFSVLIPVYNGGAFLRQAIASVLAQSFQDFEIVVVDDGSTDGACSTLHDIGDQRLRILTQANLGPAAACNAGLAVARGKYVAFLDQDDLWMPAKLRRHLEVFESDPSLDLTFTWYGYIGERGQDLGYKPRLWSGRVGFERLLWDNVIGPTSAVAIRRQAIEDAGGFDPDLRLSYDIDLHLRVARLRPGNVSAIPEVLAAYRRHPHQMSRDWRALQRDWQALLAKYRRLDPQAADRAERKGNSVMSHYLASVAYERREFSPAIGLLGAALRRDPAGVALSPGHWRILLACLAGLALPKSLHQRLEALAGLEPYAAHDAAGESK